MVTNNNNDKLELQRIIKEHKRLFPQMPDENIMVFSICDWVHNKVENRISHFLTAELHTEIEKYLSGKNTARLSWIKKYWLWFFGAITTIALLVTNLESIINVVNKHFPNA